MTFKGLINLNTCFLAGPLVLVINLHLHFKQTKNLVNVQLNVILLNQIIGFFNLKSLKI